MREKDVLISSALARQEIYQFGECAPKAQSIDAGTSQRHHGLNSGRSGSEARLELSAKNRLVSQCVCVCVCVYV